MSQSKISIIKSKEFTIRHVFENVDQMNDGDTIEGPIEHHYNIPWKIRLEKHKNRTIFSLPKNVPYLQMHLDCPVECDFANWFITIHIIRKLETRDINQRNADFGKDFRHGETSTVLALIDRDMFRDCIIDGKVTIEMTVRINKWSLNFDQKVPRNFGESGDKHSDVVLIVGDQKFHVNKMYLATHCSYFDTLFFGNSANSGKVEFELKDITPEDVQRFLEFLYLHSAIEAHSVLRLLYLADFFDSKNLVKKCEEFLIYKLGLPWKQKFEAAIKYNFDGLKIKCISEIKTIEELESFIPKENAQFENAVWKELYLKSLEFLRRIFPTS